MAASLSLETELPNTDKQDKALQRMQRAQWLRAAILGANDGLLSTASLMLGIGAAKDNRDSMIISGIAGALAGACSMAVGEFVSVSMQMDIQMTMISKSRSDGLLDLEMADKIKLQVSTANPSAVVSKITEASSTPKTSPFVKLTGEIESSEQSFSHVLTPSSSPMMQVMVTDARVTIANQDDVKEKILPNPSKAAAASGLAFLCGAIIPLVAAMTISHHRTRIVVLMVVTSVALALFGGLGALLGGSPIRKSAVRVVVGGWISMSITYGLLKAFNVDHKAHEALSI